MATKKTAKKPAQAVAKAPSTKKIAPPAKKLPAARKKPPAKGKPPAKKPGRPRAVPLVVNIDYSSLTLQDPPDSSAKAYETLLFIDPSKLTQAQMDAITTFVDAFGLHVLTVARGKGYGGP